MQNSPQKTVSVLGCPIALIDYAGAVEKARCWARRGDRAYAIEAANTHVVALARHDRAFGEAMNAFDLWLPDGMPLVWCVNSRVPAAQRLADRVYGPTFMLRCLEATVGGGHPGEGHFFLGGTTELLETLRVRLLARFPGLRIAGMYAPPFGDWPAKEDDAIKAAIAASGAGFVWVGLGCPRQERWISQHLASLPPAVYFGIGAAFAFHAGRVRQAPAWMQRIGLEWLFRLAAEPRRLFRRYCVYNSLFLFYWLFDWRERRSSSA